MIQMYKNKIISCDIKIKSFQKASQFTDYALQIRGPLKCSSVVVYFLVHLLLGSLLLRVVLGFFAEVFGFLVADLFLPAEPFLLEVDLFLEAAFLLLDFLLLPAFLAAPDLEDLLADLLLLFVVLIATFLVAASL